ncbi:MAG TPA: tetratricopeptide repeat protein, partial [Bryobacteraceae bacterium]|nr:tetratricopeptide repeat protein [Bryobacteraceae bacterium]
MPKKRDQPAPRRTSTRSLLIAAVLVVATFVIYRPVKGFDFVRYDDQDLVLENEHIREGITARNIGWALTTADSANWYPLTRLSQMLDIELFGLDAGRHHLTNVAIHALAGALLFFLLRRLTGADWPSAAVAFLFLLHPLHVESVAWIAERKDVLSTLFWFVTIWAYLDYVARPSGRRYALIIAAFLCGLMSKPMIVTLPLLLMLLDIWPLKRGWQIRDKIPLFALSAVVSIITFLAQRNAGAMGLKVPLFTRIGNAAISCIVYLAQFFWPAKLAVFYPYPTALPMWQVAGSTVLLIAISLAAWRFRERAPYFIIGWAWYLITLLPVIGLVQVGHQAHADRYTYVPSIGISIAMAWGVSEALAKFTRLRPLVVSLASVAALGCVMTTAAQLNHWKDSETLFRHALAVTQGNYVAHHNLGSALWRSGRPAEAAEQYRATLALQPQNGGAHGGLGQALVQQGDLQGGVAELTEAVRLGPTFADARFLLGSVLGRIGRPSEAIEHLTEAVRLRPQDADFHYNLANALAVAGRMDEAIVEFRAALERNPSDAMTYYSLGNALATRGRLDDAIANFEQALRLRPGMQEARQRL